MTTLSLVKTAPQPFSPAPITDEEAAAMFRAALKIFRLWGVTERIMRRALLSGPRTASQSGSPS